MIAREIPVRLTLPPPKTERSAGVHCSAIIRCIATEHGILKKEWAEELSLVDVREITDQTAILRIRLGLAWEEHYIPTLPDVVDHPGEMEVQGIFMTHDGESLSTVLTQAGIAYALIVHEVKLTWKSTNTVGNIEAQWMWLAQIKAYCKGLNTRFAFIHVYFVNGDYKYPLRPLMKIWEIEFTQDEIEENWDLLRSYMEERLVIERNLLEA